LRRERRTKAQPKTESTFIDMVRAGHERIRKTVWANANAYLRIHIVNKGFGPWGYLYDRTSQEGIGEPTPQTMTLFQPGTEEDPGWEPYAGPRDSEDKDSN
jgi:hypothetical protein